MNILIFLLILIGTILLFLAAFAIGYRRVHLGWLGLALIAVAVWVIPAISAL
jgi:hypothetical protein